MSESFGVVPSELRAASRQLGAVSERLAQVLGSLRDRLGGEGAAWGDDRIGDSFAHGPGGYLAQRDWVDESVRVKKDLLDVYEGLLGSAADAFERDDRS